ncbi:MULTISPECIES: hypothetical protein, partial [Sphingomonas]|uniref:hypothetical protein n=1 Tax=Sphingomonas TaxID=13687 RepID=UPI001C6716F2
MDRGKARKRRRGDVAHARRRDTVEALLANIVAAHLNAVDPDRFVGVSFNRRDYDGTDLCRNAMAACRDYLAEQELIEIGPGFRRRDHFGDGHFGRRTRIRATAQFRTIIDEARLGKRPLTLATGLLIRLKAPRDDAGPMPQQIRDSGDVMKAVNRRLAATHISVPQSVVKVSCPLLSGPDCIIVWNPKENWDGRSQA